jgi:hypothetical protein
VFVEVADTLVDDFDVVEFLQLLTQRVAGLFGTVVAGLMLADHRNRLTFMAASDGSARLMEVYQLQHDDGPCLDAYRTGQPVANVKPRCRHGSVAQVRAPCRPGRLRLDACVSAASAQRSDRRDLPSLGGLGRA